MIAFTLGLLIADGVLLCVLAWAWWLGQRDHRLIMALLEYLHQLRGEGKLDELPEWLEKELLR